MPSFLSSDEAGTQLSAYLSRNPTARRTFPKNAHADLLRLTTHLVKSIAPTLPEDIHPEVVSEMWADLEKNLAEVTFEPQRGTARTFFKNRLRNALKAVQSDYTPPGRPTRNRGDREDDAVDSPVTVSLEALTDENLLESATDMRTVEARLTVTSLLQQAPPPVARALYLIYSDGASVESAAKEVGMSRFQFHRAYGDFQRKARSAA